MSEVPLQRTGGRGALWYARVQRCHQVTERERERAREGARERGGEREKEREREREGGRQPEQSGRQAGLQDAHHRNPEPDTLLHCPSHTVGR